MGEFEDVFRRATKTLKKEIEDARDNPVPYKFERWIPMSLDEYLKQIRNSGIDPEKDIPKLLRIIDVMQCALNVTHHYSICGYDECRNNIQYHCEDTFEIIEQIASKR